ncbi:MAG: chromosomal replication initiator protein DnaA [Planctomycetota bacterium]
MSSVDPVGELPESIHREIAARLSRPQYETWFQRVRFEPAGSDRVHVLVPSGFHQAYLRNRYLPVIIDSIRAAARIEEPTAEFLVDADRHDNHGEERPQGSGPKLDRNGIAAEPIAARAADRSRRPAVPRVAREPIPLNRGYTFDQFVTGHSNRLAHAAASSVSENPGRVYNPLFIHGAVGLGKTHLLQAVAHRYLARSMERVIYVSCASFTNEFIAAVGRNELEGFRDRYRHAGALLIDDIQFLANKERTQEEFFHTFNSIYNRQAQILLTSDSLPSEITGLGDRLVSRFKHGMLAQLSPPSLETRMAILLRKGTNLGIEIPQEIAEFVAQRVRENIREIEGAALRLHSQLVLEKRPLSIESVRHSLAELLGDREDRVDILAIQQASLEEFDVRPADLYSKSRQRSIVIPRQICMYLARRHTNLSLGEIGLHFGGRDHSTVHHSVEKIRSLLKKSGKVRRMVDSIERRLGR